MRRLWLLIFGLVTLATATAQEHPAGDWDRIVLKRNEVLAIHRRAEIPRQVMRAIEKVNCKVDEELLQQRPIQIFRPTERGRTFAIVTCDNPYATRSFLLQFVRALRSEPEPYCVATVAYPRGFSTTCNEGHFHWDAGTKRLTLKYSNDIANEARLLQTYEFRVDQIVLLKAEYRYEHRGPEPWKLIWEISDFPPIDRPKE